MTGQSSMWDRVRRRWPGLYVGVICAAGGVAVLGALTDPAVRVEPLPTLGLAALSILGGFATLRMPAVAASFSISDAFTMTAALAFGPSTGTLIVALDSLAISWRLARRRKPDARRALFNATAPPLAMWLSAQLLFVVGGFRPLSQETVGAVRLFGPMVLFAAVYFLLNTGVVAYAVALDTTKAFRQVWREHFVGLWISYVAGALIATVLVLLVYGHSPAATALVAILPLPVALYAFYKGSLHRLAEQIEHLDRVNQLYHSTIETLAHAIDAKDQVTHGHIRRVQVYSLRLASALGMTDGDALRALEAAALLHDTGKLAIPEHILNKPDKLSRTEFEVMKTHAAIGADILSKVDFPFPVVPIVRHHHESWDGTGYPDGLREEAIPIGARILSVIDCFDALTSDRPYRRRLPDAEAIAVLRQRRGTMYDPAVVDAFIEAHEGGAFREHRDTSEAEAEPTGTGVVLVLPTASRDRLNSVMLDLGAALLEPRTPSEIAELLHLHLASALPVTTVAVFEQEPGTERLVATAVSGDHAEELTGLAMEVSERLTGWVAANRKPIVNADAALDLMEVGQSGPRPLRFGSSVPLVAGSQLVGALTVYSSLEPFVETDTAALVAIAQRVAPAIAATAAALPRSADRPDSKVA